MASISQILKRQKLKAQRLEHRMLKYIKTRRAQMYGVGENPLNRNGAAIKKNNG